MDWPELAFAILRVIRYWSPGPSRERSVGCSASKRRNSCPCGSVGVERLIVSSRCARWLPAASEPTRCCQSLPLATTAAALCHHRCNCLPRGKRASHGARWREQVRKARTPTPYTLYAAALGATARGMLCSHTVPHRFAVASETHVAQRRMARCHPFCLLEEGIMMPSRDMEPVTGPRDKK